MGHTHTTFLLTQGNMALINQCIEEAKSWVSLQCLNDDHVWTHGVRVQEAAGSSLPVVA